MVTFGEKFVERVEKALVETVVVQHCTQMPMTIDDCWKKIQTMGFDGKVDRDFVADAYKRLTKDGHLKDENGRYTATEDGREDVQKLGSILQNVVGQFNGGSMKSPMTGGTTGGAIGGSMGGSNLGRR